MMSQRTLLAATVMLASSAALAQPQGMYLNAQVVASDVEVGSRDFDTGVGLAATVGAGLPDVTPGFAVEGEITGTVDDPSKGGDDFSYFTIGGYAAYIFPVSPAVDIKGRVGATYIDSELERSNGPDDEDEDFEFSFGVGAGFAVARDVNLIVEYTFIEEDINHFSGGVQFTF